MINTAYRPYLMAPPAGGVPSARQRQQLPAALTESQREFAAVAAEPSLVVTGAALPTLVCQGALSELQVPHLTLNPKHPGTIPQQNWLQNASYSLGSSCYSRTVSAHVSSQPDLLRCGAQSSMSTFKFGRIQHG